MPATLPPFNPSPLFIAQANEASIRSRAAAANALGGGTVLIPPGTIALSQPLAAYSGVVYEGTGWQASFGGGQTQGISGTILTGNGTFDGVDYNAVDGVTPPTVYQTFVAGMINGFGLRNLTFVNFSYGVKIGALYQPGMQYGEFARLNFINCQQWGLWVENYIECRFEDINAVNCQVGGVARVGSGNTALFCGNSRWSGTFVGPPASLYARGLVSWARGGNTFINDNASYGEQVNRSPTTVLSQTATFTSASANIAVTDSTKFPVGLPVTVAATAAGFVANEVYFVLSSAANVITLGSTTYGSAISATASTSVSMLSQGYPNLEIAGLTSTDFVTAETVLAVDLESQATMTAFLQNARQCTVHGGYISPWSAGGVNYRTFVVRISQQCDLRSLNNMTLDMDLNSGTSCYVSGLRGEWNAIDFTTNKGLGIGIGIVNQTGQRSSIGRGVLYLNGFNSPDIYMNVNTNGVDVSKALTVDTYSFTNASTLSISTGSSWYNTYTSAGGAATLSAIGTSTSGTFLYISNPQANAITINTAGETINGQAGVTSFSLAAGGVAILQAFDAGGAIGKYWSRYV